MKWFEISISTTHELSELVADILQNAGSEGVSIFDKNDLLSLVNEQKSWDYIDQKLLEQDEQAIVKGYFPSREPVAAILQDIESLKAATPFACGTLELSISEVGGDDWLNHWKKYYEPIELENVVIVPKWIDYQGKIKNKVLIDPGMAFGTGSHETTSACILLLQRICAKDKTIIDVGCGSGILAITALKLGARFAYLRDIDELAVKAAKSNAKLNGISKQNALIECGSFLEGYEGRADIIFANVTADALLVLSKDIKKFVSKGGYVIASGIIEGRQNEVQAAFEAVGFAKCQCLKQKDWYSFLFLAQ